MYFYLLPADRPGTGDYKMPDVRPCITFYKRLHNSFVYEHKFTKLTQNVYVNKDMSFIISFSLILKNKTLLLWLCYSHSSQLFRRN